MMATPHACVCLLLALALAAPVPPAAPEDDAGRYVWDLSTLYADDAAWEAERAGVERRLGEIGRLRGTVGRDARNLADALDEVYDLRSRAAKLAVYGFLVHDVDTRSDAAAARYDVGSGLEIRVESAVKFVDDEVRAVGAARLERWLREEPRLERHGRRIHRILLETPYALAPEAQPLLESMARWPRLSADVFDELHAADLAWPTVRGRDGADVVVDLAAYGRLRRSPDRDERARAMRAYLGRLRSIENLFGLALVRRVEADLVIARHRKFGDGMDALWFLRDGFPPGTHGLMVDVARRNLPTLRRYVGLRRRAFGLDRVTYPDLFADPPAIDRRFTVADAADVAVAASAPLGAEFQARMRECLAKPWMHLAPSPEKRGTYAVFPPVGGAAPYFLMSYRSRFRDSRQFAGAAVGMTVFADIPRDRLPDTRDDPPVYTNSTLYVGYLLHDDYLASRAADRAERAAYVFQELDLIASIYFRWTLMAELEAKVQSLIAAGDTPTGARVSAAYLGLLREYYGPDVVIDNVFGGEWMTLSVPFLSYEDQFWPAAMAAACSVVERLRAGDPSARRYTRLLGRGDVDLSYQLLKEAGIDMTSPAPYESVIRRMNARMDELERLL